MSFILNLETATKNCSVALAKDGITIACKELATENFSHAEKLHVFIAEVLVENNIQYSDLNAVAVSQGRGDHQQVVFDRNGGGVGSPWPVDDGRQGRPADHPGRLPEQSHCHPQPGREQPGTDTGDRSHQRGGGHPDGGRPGTGGPGRCGRRRQQPLRHRSGPGPYPTRHHRWRAPQLCAGRGRANDRGRTDPGPARYLAQCALEFRPQRPAKPGCSGRG